jgi:hypothetical protein
MTERSTINRVQPDYLDKQDLIPNQYKALTAANATPEELTPQLLAKEPVFVTQNTLIGKPTNSGFVGLTSYNSVDKIRWQVTEDLLIARQSYEFVKNAPGGGTGIGGNPWQTGDVVAAFKISSHFDIRRDYNTTTGEELNVLVENSSDRPWYQRQYMRVDWSQNLVTGYATIFDEQDWNGQLNAEPVPVFFNTPNDPNAPVFEYQGQGDQRKLVYFDIVNSAVLHPETTMLSYVEDPAHVTTFSQIPLCFLGEGESDCAPAQVTMRLAFRRVDPDRDYEPASLTEALPNAQGQTQPIAHLNMERFGFFDVMRIGYDTTANATLDTQRLHVAARHNLWIHHHVPAYDTETSTECNTDADCGDAKLICKIGNDARNATHRGVCSTVGISHRDDDIPCSTDDECRQYSDTGGVSKTAVCDQANHTCGDRYLRCSSDADCTDYDPASSCDLASAYMRADNRGLCLLPFRQRQVRQIPYHESINYPDYMQPVTESIVSEWNAAFSGAVTSARTRECQLANAGATTGSPATSDPTSDPCAAKGITGLDPALGADAQFVYVGCHSPVWGTADGPGKHTQDEVDQAHGKGWDLPVCGPQGTNARLGDLRYSMIGAITDQDQQGYWGLANISGDPETGEVFAGRGAVWQTITDYYATQVVTYVKLLTGKLTPDQVDNGSDLVSSMQALGTGHTPSAHLIDDTIRTRGLSHITEPFTKALANQKLPGSGWFKSGSMRTNDPNNPGALDQGLKRLLSGRTLGDGTPRGDQRLLSLAGTQIEGRLMNEQQARLAPTATPDDNALLASTMNAASPMRQQSSAARHFLHNMRNQMTAYQCGIEAGFQDDLLLGLAKRLSGTQPIMASDPLDGPVAFGRDWNFRKQDNSIDFDLMTAYARQFIHHGVLAHELGHSIGQRHNFTASADAINYNDQYWKVRLQGHPKGLRPRYEYLADNMDGKYYSQQEIDGRIDEWSYSSVMDYKGFNEDAHGIGRYDLAFVKNGYVNMVEAFKTVADQNRALTYAFNTAGNGMPTMLDLGEWPSKLHGLHYIQIPDIFGKKADGTPNIGNDNRYDVFLKETESTFVPGWGPQSFSNSTLSGQVLVPYRFDSDERAGLVWVDQRYDAGPDQFESLHYVTSHLLDYYFINSYARLRSGFSTQKYVNRIWSRYLDQLRQTTQINDFDLIEWQDFFSNIPNFNDYMTKPEEFGGYVNMQAISESADTIFAILTMPEIGGMIPQQQFDGTNLVVQDTQGTGSSPMNVAVNDGRAFESSWRNDVGFWWYDMLDRAGAYYDKVMMLQALTDPDLLLLSRDTPTDIRLFQLSYYTMFPDQMIRLFGGLMSEDFSDFAPVAVGSGTTMTIDRVHVATSNTDTRTIDSTHQLLDPQTHFTMQLWSAVQGMSEFPATYDQRYMDFSRVWLDGSSEGIRIDAAKTVRFTDPFSGQTYVAIHYNCDPTTNGDAVSVGCSSYKHPSINGNGPNGAGTSNEAGIGARMLLHLADLEAVRQKALPTGSSPDPTTATAIETQERQYLDLVNVVRSMSKAFGYGDSTTP